MTVLGDPRRLIAALVILSVVISLLVSTSLVRGLGARTEAGLTQAS